MRYHADMANPVSLVLRMAERLRFPYLFIGTAVLFVVDLLVPDIVPFADELLLGLLTVIFGAWRKRRRQEPTTDASP